jgi:hypothetical protein
MPRAKEITDWYKYVQLKDIPPFFFLVFERRKTFFFSTFQISESYIFNWNIKTNLQVK